MNYFKIAIVFVVILHFVSGSIFSRRTLVHGVAALISTFFVYEYVEFSQRESCDQARMNFSAKDFESYLQDHLFGQHLVAWAVPRALKTHISKKQPNKALVMSFHGWTGSGKNYVSKIIAEALYGKGSKKEFVHWYIATRDFPHPGEANKYRDILHREILEYTKQCGQSLFIFDEVDKMEPGIIDAIKPYIDYYEEIDGIDYRKNIYIFLNNVGGGDITKVTMNSWMAGRDRENIDMREVEPLVNLAAFNEAGGLQRSEIVKKNLIDIYVPFLPLEKSHIRKCIAQELKVLGQKVSEYAIDQVINQLVFYPPQFNLYSVSGCKKISHKVDLFGLQE